MNKIWKKQKINKTLLPNTGSIFPVTLLAKNLYFLIKFHFKGKKKIYLKISQNESDFQRKTLGGKKYYLVPKLFTVLISLICPEINDDFFP